MSELSIYLPDEVKQELNHLKNEVNEMTDEMNLKRQFNLDNFIHLGYDIALYKYIVYGCNNKKYSNISCLLVKYCKDINIQLLDTYNDTMLTAAVINKEDKIAKILINRGCDINKQNSGGSTALMMAGIYCQRIAHMLINRGCDINIVNHYGYTAASNLGKNVKIMKKLINRNCRVAKEKYSSFFNYSIQFRYYYKLKYYYLRQFK